MGKIKVSDRYFCPAINTDVIQQAVKDIANKINRDYRGMQPLFVAILNGSFMFAADLFKNLTIEAEISFIKVSSYQGTKTSEKLNELIGLNQDIRGRRIIILEDIVDTGLTLDSIIKSLKKQEPYDIRVASLLCKRTVFKNQFYIDYVGLDIPDEFIVGYGLDYNGYGRNYPEIYKITD